MADEILTPRPINDQVLVRQDPVKEHVGKAGILVAPQGSEEWPITATVVAVGLGRQEKSGVRTPLEVVPGDRILFKRKANSALNFDVRESNRPEWKDLLMLREDDIIGVVEEES